MNKYFNEQFQFAQEMYHEGNTETAVEILETILESEKLTSNLRAKATRRLGDCHSRLNDQEKALEYYQKAESSCTDPNILHSIFSSKAEALAKLERYPEALECYSEAINAAEEHYDIQHYTHSAQQILQAYKRFKKFGSLQKQKETIIESLKLELDLVQKLPEGDILNHY